MRSSLHCRHLIHCVGCKSAVSQHGELCDISDSREDFAHVNEKRTSKKWLAGNVLDDAGT